MVLEGSKEQEGGDRDSLLVPILCRLPAIAQLLFISCWSAIGLLVVIATVTVIVATEATEFAIVGAVGAGQGGRKGPLSPEGPQQRRNERGGRSKRCSSNQGFHVRSQAHKDATAVTPPAVFTVSLPFLVLLTPRCPAITDILLALRHSSFFSRIFCSLFL